MFGFAGSVVALIGECITVSIFQKTGHRSAVSAAVFFLFLHIGCFSSSVDATSYIYASEIFLTPVRAKGLAVSISGLFFATIIFLQCAPLAFGAIGWKYYLVFIVITTIIFFIMWFYFPEVCKKKFPISHRISKSSLTRANNFYTRHLRCVSRISVRFSATRLSR